MQRQSLLSLFVFYYVEGLPLILAQSALTPYYNDLFPDLYNLASF